MKKILLHARNPRGIIGIIDVVRKNRIKTMAQIITLLSITLSAIIFGILIALYKKFSDLHTRLDERERNQNDLRESLARSSQEQRDYLMRVLKEQREEQLELRNKFSEQQFQNLKHLTDSLQKNFNTIQNQIGAVLKTSTENLDSRLRKLTEDTNQRLKEINNRVEQRITESFEKTTATFTDVIKRLALIDEAQKNISKLSSEVVNLQEILADKRSRGVFGEVQLEALIKNVLPEKHFSFQYTLSNNKRADCILFLPAPTGNIVIDAKFPLESFQKFSDFQIPEHERTAARSQFKNDIKKHVQDIMEKYIISGETSEGAVMFIPAEAIFAEIHAHHSDLVEHAHRNNVWMVSPSTMMALLTTVRAILKDEDTRKQAHLIREHLLRLSKDFERFQVRMDKLAQHVNQAHTDVEDVYRASKKITVRFSKIEKAELGREIETPVLLEEEN